jgi:putative endonuclease
MRNRKAQTYDKGIEAEKAAANWLRLKGYKILENRYKTKFGEIDLIVSKNNVIAFVEVKARVDKATALESITPKMQRRITQTAMYYISQNNVGDCDFRFDVITVFPTFLGMSRIEHLDNAWEASA